MKSIWKFGLPVLIAFLVVLSAVPAVTATTELTAIDPPDPNTPNIIGLSKKTIDRLIERIDVSESFAASSAKKQNTLAELQRIKTIFPNVTLADVQLIDDTLATLNKEFRSKKYPDESGSNGNNNPKWGGSGTSDPIISGTHNDLSRQAALSMGVSSSNAETVGRYALEPDEGIPYISSIGHFLPTGAADYAESNANDAKNLLVQGQTFEGYRKLAHSLHFIQDLSVPFHTIAYQNFLNHLNYENYVFNDWTSGQNFYSSTMSDPYYYEVSDVSTSAENLGNYINAYVDRIDEIMLQDSAWQSNTELITMTKDCLTQAIRYSRGTVGYVV